MGPVSHLQHASLTVPLVLLFAGLQAVKAQDFDNHRWKDRLIVVFAPDEDDPGYLKQLDQLRDARTGMEERKIHIYRILPESYAHGLDTHRWIPRKPGSVEGINAEDGFQLLLIGLDGGVKLREDTPVAPGKLWALIDAMPMRKAAIKNKGPK